MSIQQISLHDISTFIENQLDCNISDSAHNGVQIANTRGLSHLAVGVDFCAELIAAAVKAGCDGLLVHHGLYWGQVEPLTHRRHALVRETMLHDMALLAYHLPLDLHPTLGNNAGLMDALKLKHVTNFGDYKGLKILFEAVPHDQRPLSFAELVARYEETIGTPLTTLKTHDRSVRRVGLCSGGGLFGLEQAWEHGCDTYITGDTNHIAYHQAKELPINLISGGHYLTETFGVRRLSELLQKEQGLQYTFFDIPTGL